MKKETLTALEGSIKKWEKIVAGTGIDLGVDNCPLCLWFYNGVSLGSCELPDGEKCPVHAKTGLKGCGGSPYDDYVAANSYGKYGSLARYNKKTKAALRMLNFLKALRP